MAASTALLDACVLYSAPLRDLLLRLARADLFRARWTEQIHDEWVHHLRANRPDLPVEKIEHLRQLVDRSVPDCLVTDYETLVPSLELPDADDRHVLAAAIVGRVDVIVTYNLDDFPEDKLAPYLIEVQHPDDFIAHLLSLAQPQVCAVVKHLREGLKRPPMTAGEYLDNLERLSLPQTVAGLRPFIELL